MACNSLGRTGAQVFPLNVPDTVRHYIFADKVYACAQAEEMATPGVQSLVWIDPSCLIINPPQLFDLGRSFDAAVRPVHIRNVGLAPTQPLDGFWTKICAVVGTPDIPTTVEAFVDGHCIRSYFNSHAFAINPARGLLRRWFDCFAGLVRDQPFQAESCQDEPHQIFLHQAVLSALLVTSFEAERILILPPDYNYPYNLQGLVPAERRARWLNALVCIAYEDRLLDPNLVDDIRIDEPLRSWLSANWRH
jgi:hypothetical protein